HWSSPRLSRIPRRASSRKGAWPMPDFQRRATLTHVARLVGGAACAALLPGVSLADAYPSRPIKLIVGFSAGSASDYFARIFIEKMAAVLGTTVIIDNRPGGGQVAAISALKSAAPDGYTLYMATGSSLAQGPALRKDLPFD